MANPLMSTYNRLPVTFDHGQGAWLWDEQGNRYLDAISGIAVCSLGHAHPRVSRALCDQSQRLLHTSNLYGIGLQTTLAERLTALTGMDKAFFCNSGAEANEAAIKLARLHGHHKGIDNPSIVVMDNSFHGRTLATLSATGNRKVQAGFEPLVQGFLRLPFGDSEALAKTAKARHDVCAVLVEPIQCEGGVNIPPRNYLNRVRDLCDQQGWLMMLDEIQTGMGRTGRFAAHQHNGILPDVMTLAKALGNGVPIGACLARGTAAELFAPGNHGSTFGGNPLACAAALAVLEVMEQEAITDQAAQMGSRLLANLRAALAGCRGVVEIRGQGMILGIELDRPCAALVGQALQQGLLINVTAERVIRLLPPLILGSEEAERLVTTLTGIIREFLAGSPGQA
jgi:acetylornithine/N-succinyldiaminopimelate aminotransferase